MTSGRAADKIVDRAVAVERVRVWRESGETVVLANGVFDVLHVGHARYLEGARAEGTKLVVGVNGDAATAALKGAGRPVMAEAERALLVAALRVVDLVVIFPEPSADALMTGLRPQVHAKGTDYRPDTVPERATADAVGARTTVTGDPKAHASRELVERIRALHASDGR